MRITDLSLREKVLQTAIVRVDNKNFYPEKVGGIFIGGAIIDEPDESIELEKTKEASIRYKEHADIPILVCSDFENGCGRMIPGLSVFPMLMGLGATNDEKLAYDYGKATALEARSIGANWSFTPICDLNIEKRCPIINVRGLTDDAEYAVKMLRQVVRGMQENGLAACAKHFPGDGLDWRDSHMVTTSNPLSVKEWWETSGKVFEQMIKENIYSVMIGHANFPAYQKETFENGFKLPASLSAELMTNLLKKEMGFQGVVVTDALDMGGCLGFYDSPERTEIESFKAGADMVLWPTKKYVDNMIKAVENGYISMERLDDAVTRILDMKEKMGLFKETSPLLELSEKDKEYVKSVQRNVAEKSITLIRDKAGFFPLSPQKTPNIAVVPITHYDPAFKQAELLVSELQAKGFNVSYFPIGIEEEQAEACDVIIYALFSRSHQPIGFMDFMKNEAIKVAAHNKYGQKKNLIVSFGSPYFDGQYYERALTYVNAYSMVAPSVKAFVKAAIGEIEFSTFSPVKL